MGRKKMGGNQLGEGPPISGNGGRKKKSIKKGKKKDEGWRAGVLDVGEHGGR